MRLTIFGATGGTGRELVKQALAKGHRVTAYVRTPSKLPIEDEVLTVVAGELDSAEKIAAAVRNADAVLSALGPTSNKPGTPLTDGMAHIIAAMQAEGVSRLIVTSGAGVSDPNDQPGLINHLISLALKLFARHVLRDSEGMVNAVRRSDLDWTIVRAPRLTDQPARGEFKAGYVGQGPGTQLTRADYARFLLDQLEEGQWIRKAPMVSN